jgi:hypothetical protein
LQLAKPDAAISVIMQRRRAPEAVGGTARILSRNRCCAEIVDTDGERLPLLESRFKMLKGRKKELWDKADAERKRCRQWLLAHICPGQPKRITKAALRETAMRELKISKTSFDAAWIGAIEETGRHDWYEPMRRNKRTRQ